MKLHLGCGNAYLDGWVNIDLDSPVADIKDDVLQLSLIPDDSCEIIYACHILEHLGRKGYMDALSLWKTKLKKGGVLRLAVPDLQKVLKLYDGTNLKSFWGFLYGGQRTKYDYHSVGFDFHSLEEDLRDLGFSSVYTWDWKEVEHGTVDDYSQAYLPHMDKENGELMSLNIEAVK